MHSSHVEHKCSAKIAVIVPAWINPGGNYTLSEARSGVDWVDLMAAQGAFGTDFYDRSIIDL